MAQGANWREVDAAEPFAKFLRLYAEWGDYSNEDLAFFCRTSVKSVYKWRRGEGPSTQLGEYYRKLLISRRDDFRDLRDRADSYGRL